MSWKHIDAVYQKGCVALSSPNAARARWPSAPSIRTHLNPRPHQPHHSTHQHAGVVDTVVLHVVADQEQRWLHSGRSQVSASTHQRIMDSKLKPSAHHLSSNSLQPTLDYEEADLGSLEPGPRNLMLMGRIVNFYNVAKPSKQHKAAQGYLKIQLADDTGVITVRLWYNNTIYAIRLGQLVTLWTVHVSNSSEHNSLAPSSAPLFTSIFPEGERNCCFMVHVQSDDGTQFKRPFGCMESRALTGLMTLRSFADGGYDVDESKLLVCVKSIGARKKCTSPHLLSRLLIQLTIATRYEPQRHNL